MTAARITRRAALGVVLFALLGGLSSFESLFAPSSDLWAAWTAHDEGSPLTVDHSAWDAILARYRSRGADGVARFAYRKVTAADRGRLDSYIAALAKTPVSKLSRAQQFAYWVNLYNALTVRVVLDHPGVKSIRDIDISPGLFADGPWGKALVTIEGRAVTLNDIEHRILRPIFKDPRIHYAVNCASIGCPDLSPKAYTAANKEAMLEAAAHAYVNHPRGAHFEADGLHISSIYVWFAEDFGGEAGVVPHLRKYATGDLARKLAGVSDAVAHGYDWSLNDAQR